MGDMLFEKFLDEMGINNADLFFFIAYHGIGKLLAEFETWLAYNGWLRDEDEGTGDEGDEYEETPEEVVDVAIKRARVDIESVEGDHSWNQGAKYALRKVKEKIEE